MIDALTVTGGPATCLDRTDEYRSAGADFVVLVPVESVIDETMEILTRSNTCSTADGDYGGTYRGRSSRGIDETTTCLVADSTAHRPPRRSPSTSPGHAQAKARWLKGMGTPLCGAPADPHRSEASTGMGPGGPDWDRSSRDDAHKGKL